MLLNFREYGERGGEPLLLLHGLFGSLDNWHTVARRLAEERWIVSIDLRNHGGSPHSPEFSYPLLAQDVAEVVDHLGVERAAVLGHSMGGKTAMELALSRPGKIARLIVVDIAPKRYPPHHEDLRDALLSVDLQAIGSRKAAEAALARRIPDQALRLFLLKNLSRDDHGRFRWELDLASIAANFDAIWAAINGERSYAGPVLFLRGARSHYIVDEDLPSIRRLFPRALLATIEGAGHWVHAEQPESLIGTVASFLRQDLTNDVETAHPLS